MWVLKAENQRGPQNYGKPGVEKLSRLEEAENQSRLSSFSSRL